MYHYSRNADRANRIVARWFKQFPELRTQFLGQGLDQGDLAIALEDFFTSDDPKNFWGYSMWEWGETGFEDVDWNVVADQVIANQPVKVEG
jgi:hypothetical protein